MHMTNYKQMKFYLHLNGGHHFYWTFFAYIDIKTVVYNSFLLVTDMLSDELAHGDMHPCTSIDITAVQFQM